MRLRKRYLPLVALLGAAVAVLPTIASSSTSASITAVDSGFYEHSWRANGMAPAEVGVTPASAVSFAYPSGTSHHFPVFEKGPATPSCSGLPTSFATSGPGWSGSCSFSSEGVYEFWCGVHGSTMKAFVYVNASGTVSTTTMTSTSSSTTMTSSSSSTTTTTTTPPPTMTTQAATTSTPRPPGGGSSQPQTTTPAEAGEGSLAPALVLSRSQRGGVVRGSTEIDPAQRGSRLEVDLLTKSASLARAHHSTQVRVGRLVRSSVAAGKVTFSVSLNAQGRRALRRHGRLALTVKVTLTPPHGATVTATRSIVLYR